MTQKTNISTETEPGYELFLNHTASASAKSSFLYLKHVGHHHFKGKSLYYDHKGFDSIHLLYTLGGKGHLFFRNKHYDIEKGQVMIINCIEHCIMYSDPVSGWHYKWIHFNGFNSGNLFEMIYDKFGPVIESGNNQYIPHTIDYLIEMILVRDINIEVKASNTMNNLLTYILLNGNCNEIQNDLVNSRVKAVIDFIEKNHASNIKYDELMQIACYSRYHLSRIFKAVTGYNPHEYIVKYRINTAKGLLKSTGMTVDEIARTVGFESTSNFINTFKKFENITPLRFKKTLFYKASLNG